MEEITALTDDKDTWTFPWNGNKYSTKKVYLALVKSQPATAPFKWIWKSPCLPKHKFFFWLLLQDRLNAKDLMDRKHLCVETKECVLCDNSSRETMQHLFFSCTFSSLFWSRIGIICRCDLPFIDMLIDAKTRSSNQFFDFAMMAGCWGLWNHRNRIIFDNDNRCIDACFAIFAESVSVIRHRIKPSLKDGLQNWLDSL